MKRYLQEHLIYTLFLAALLPVILLRDATPVNELRYLSIADEALRNHTFFTFSNHGLPYADKPPLYLWAIMLCRWIAGGHRIWLLSLFSLLPAIGIIRTMDRWVTCETDSGSRALARLMLSTSGLFLGAAAVLRMDMLMCFFIVLSLKMFWQMSAETGKCGRSRWMFPLSVFLGIFTKGPMGLLIPLCSTTAYLALTGRTGQFFRYWGLRTWGVLSVCCAVWFGAVYAEGGTEYLHDMLVHQTIDRAVDSFHHKEPFWYYAVCIWYCMAPWSLIVAGVSAASLRRVMMHSSLQRFFLTTGVTTVLLLSCVSSKLQIYMLPAVPFLVYATAMSMPHFKRSRWMLAAVMVPAIMFIAVLPALYAAVSFGFLPPSDKGMFYVPAAILSLGGTCSLCLLIAGRLKNGLPGAVRCMGAGMLLAVFAAGWALPKTNAWTGYGMLCAKALELSHRHGISEFRAWRITRPENMDVYLHRPVSVVSEVETPVSGDRPFILLTRSRELGHFPDRRTYTVGRFAIVLCP